MDENVMEFEEKSNKRDINYFLTEEVELQEVEVVISDRFKDKKGEPVPFVLKELDQPHIEEIEKECTNPIYSKKGRKKVKIHEELDSRRYIARLMVEATVFPDFKSQEMRKHYGYEDPVEGLKKVLPKPSEYNTLMEAVLDLLGLEDDDENEFEQAKN